MAENNSVGEDVTDSIQAPGSNSRFPSGNLEYQFFSTAFQLLFQAGVQDADSMSERFIRSAHSGNGVMDFNNIIIGIRGYSRTLNKLVDLLGCVDCQRLRQLYNLSVEITELRHRQLAQGMQRGDSDKIIGNHTKVLQLWRTVQEHLKQLMYL